MWKKISNLNLIQQEGRIYILCIDLTTCINDFDQSIFNSSLSSDEKCRMESFRFDHDRYIYGVSRYALRLVCSEILNINPKQIDIQFSEYGKPYLSEYDRLQFNISHSSNIILLGIGSDNPLGVDVEVYDTEIDHLDLSKSVFSPEEIEVLYALENSDSIIEGFYNCWTKKESYIKAKGLGLQLPLDSFTVRVYNEGNYNLLHAVEGVEETKKWKLYNFPMVENYAAACTYDSTIHSVHYLDISEHIYNQLFN